MRVILDVGVAVIALEAAVDARRKLSAVDCDAVTGGILHGLIAVACQAIRLCTRSEWRQHQEKRYKNAESRHGARQSCEVSGGRAEEAQRRFTPKGTDSHCSAYAPPSPNVEGA